MKNLLLFTFFLCYFTSMYAQVSQEVSLGTTFMQTTDEYNILGGSVQFSQEVPSGFGWAFKVHSGANLNDVYQRKLKTLAFDMVLRYRFPLGQRWHLLAAAGASSSYRHSVEPVLQPADCTFGATVEQLSIHSQQLNDYLAGRSYTYERWYTGASLVLGADYRLTDKQRIALELPFNYYWNNRLEQNYPLLKKWYLQRMITLSWVYRFDG